MSVRKKCKSELVDFNGYQFRKCMLDKLTKSFWCEICVECFNEHKDLQDFVYHDLVIAGTCKLVGCKHHKIHKSGRFLGDNLEYPCKIIELR